LRALRPPGRGFAVMPHSYCSHICVNDTRVVPTVCSVSNVRIPFSAKVFANIGIR